MLCAGLYLSFPPTRQDLTQGHFYTGDFKEAGGQERAETHTLLDDGGHWLTRCNVKQMSLMDLDSLNIMRVRHLRLLIAWTRPENIVLCWWRHRLPAVRRSFPLESIIDREPHPARKPRLKSLVQPHLSRPSSTQDLTQGLFIVGFWVEMEVGHKSRRVPCWTQFSAMWAR